MTPGVSPVGQQGPARGGRLHQASAAIPVISTRQAGFTSGA